jgi:hypothetical protein
MNQHSTSCHQTNHVPPAHLTEPPPSPPPGIISHDLLAIARAYVERYEAVVTNLNLPLPAPPPAPAAVLPGSSPQDEVTHIARRLRQFNSSYAGGLAEAATTA